MFKRHGKSIKFCLVGLSALETSEITKLIIGNGGEVCNSFTAQNRYTCGDVVHVNYIHECLKQGKLLDLQGFSAIDFQSHAQKTAESFIAVNDKCRIHTEHDYAKDICGKKEPAGNWLANKSLTLSNPALLIVLGSLVDDLPLMHRLVLTAICSLVENSVVEEESGSPKERNEIDMSLEKSPQESKALKQTPLTPPFVIIRKWIKRTENKFPSAIEKQEENVEQRCCRPTENRPQTDDEKLALQEQQVESITISPKIRTRMSMRTRSRRVRKLPVASGSETDENHAIPKNNDEFYELDDCPLAERLKRLQTSREVIEESENSDELMSISPTLRKRRILSSSDVDSDSSIATVFINGLNGQKEPLNRDKESLDMEELAEINEDSYDSEKTVLWGNFSWKKRANTDRRKPRCIDDDSTDTEAVPQEDSGDWQIKFSKTKEYLDSTKTNSSHAPSNKSIPLLILISSSSDETEYEADTELDDVRSKKAASSRDIPGLSQCTDLIKDEQPIGDTENLDSKQSREPQELQDNSTADRPDNSATASNENRNNVVSSTRSNNDVVLISDESDSVAALKDDSVSHRNSSRHSTPRDSDSSSEAETTNVPNRLTKPTTKKTPGRIERRNMNTEKRNENRHLTRNFARWEQKQMIRYLIDNESISFARGNKVWKDMLKKGILKHRTYQSLNNHFRKYILPIIDQFRMNKSDLKKFQLLSHRNYSFHES